MLKLVLVRMGEESERIRLQSEKKMHARDFPKERNCTADGSQVFNVKIRCLVRQVNICF